MTFQNYPKSASRNASQALAYREQYGRGGTLVGITRAHQLKNRESLSLDTLKRMYSYFRRHEIDKQSPHWDKPSNGKIAWLLWGGDSAYKWVTRMRTKLMRAGKW
jgi:hypothetical protein